MSMKAYCVVGPNGKPCEGTSPTGIVTGRVEFEQAGEDAPCVISYNITGLAPGKHGFHMYATLPT